MNIKDFCVNKNQSLKETMKVIDTSGYGIAFVVSEDKKLLGVVTDSDIRRSLLKGVTLEESVDKVMNKNPITLSKEALKNKNISLEKFPLYGMLQVPIIDDKKRVTDIILVSKKEIIGRLSNGKTKINKIKCVLVVGGAGYLGSVLCRELLEKGYKVRVLDNLMYGNDGIKSIYQHENFDFVFGDIRDLKAVVKAIKDVDAVIHLAAIVGDPASDLNPEETIESNYLASKMLAEVCKYSQINRFIFASTCSVYGASKSNKQLTEESPLNPVSLYAKMKLKSEQGILELEDENFAPTIFRMGTLHGLSPRMRFDLVVNTLTIKALKDKEFTIFGGEQWRAFCHVEDAAEAYINCLETSIKDIKGQIFNIATENLQIKEVGKLVKEHLHIPKIIIQKYNKDIRNYCVSSSKAQVKLNFNPNLTIDDTVLDIDSNFDLYEDYPNPKYSNYEFLKGEYDY